MCGIFGIIHYGNSNLFLYDINHIIELTDRLLEASQSRGRDASGVCVVDKQNNAYLFKHNVPGKNLCNMDQYKSMMDKIGYQNSFKCMIGHTRSKTQGTETNNLNNHPIIADKVIGVHNGVINNDHHLFKVFTNEFNRDGQVDSEIIFKLVNHYVREKHTLVEAVKKTARSLTGSYSCAFIHTDYPDYMTLFGGYSVSITMHHFKHDKIIAFASTDYILKEAAKSIHQFKNPSSKLDVGSNTGIRINIKDGKVYTFELDKNTDYNHKRHYLY